MTTEWDLIGKSGTKLTWLDQFHRDLLNDFVGVLRFITFAYALNTRPTAVAAGI